MFEIGRVCVKIAGRDAKGYCVIVDVLDNNYVLVDGEVRRRKVNSLHLMPIDQKIDIKKGASHEEISKAFEKLGYTMWNTKPKNAGEKPKRAHINKEKIKKEDKKTAKSIQKGPNKKKETNTQKSEKINKTEKPEETGKKDVKDKTGNKDTPDVKKQSKKDVDNLNSIDKSSVNKTD